MWYSGVWKTRLHAVVGRWCWFMWLALSNIFVHFKEVTCSQNIIQQLAVLQKYMMNDRVVQIFKYSNEKRQWAVAVGERSSCWFVLSWTIPVNIYKLKIVRKTLKNGGGQGLHGVVDVVALDGRGINVGMIGGLLFSKIGISLQNVVSSFGDITVIRWGLLCYEGWRSWAVSA